jgi:predicted flap endonuclease-1-like 5' DNA nuclease
VQPRFFEDFNNYWRQTQQRWWTSSPDLGVPAYWSRLWGQNAWTNTDWTGLNAPHRTLPTDWAVRSAEQIKQTLSPAPYLQASRYGTRTAHTCLDLQKQIWDYWFGLVRSGADISASLPAKTKATKRKPTAATRKRSQPAAKIQAKTRAPKKPAVRGQAATASVQLELGANDDLKRIAGIGPGLEKRLKDKGIVSYRQIAELSPMDIQHLEATIIKFQGRILRDNWIGQAKALCQH